MPCQSSELIMPQKSVDEFYGLEMCNATVDRPGAIRKWKLCSATRILSFPFEFGDFRPFIVFVNFLYLYGRVLIFISLYPHFFTMQWRRGEIISIRILIYLHVVVRNNTRNLGRRIRSENILTFYTCVPLKDWILTFWRQFQLPAIVY